MEIWKGIDNTTAKYYANGMNKKENQVKTDNLALHFEEGVAIFNEHLTSIFADDDSED